MEHRTHLVVTLALLLLLTAVSLTLFEYALPGNIVAVIILPVAAIKGWFIIDNFMGLRHANGPWRMVLTSYVVALAVIILLMRWFAELVVTGTTLG